MWNSTFSFTGLLSWQEVDLHSITGIEFWVTRAFLDLIWAFYMLFCMRWKQVVQYWGYIDVSSHSLLADNLQISYNSIIQWHKVWYHNVTILCTRFQLHRSLKLNLFGTAKFESRGVGWPTYGFPGPLSCYSLPTTSFLFNAPNEKADSSYVGDLAHITVGIWRFRW